MKYTPKNSIKVDGKMSEQGADTAGKRLATAAVIAAIGFAIGSACGGLALVLKLFIR
jgi:hypothetical protein